MHSYPSAHAVSLSARARDVGVSVLRFLLFFVGAFAQTPCAGPFRVCRDDPAPVNLYWAFACLAVRHSAEEPQVRGARNPSHLLHVLPVERLDADSVSTF